MTRHLRTALLAIIGLVAIGPATASATYLILGAPNTASWNNDVLSKIAATGVLAGGIDVINAATTTPTLATLKTYAGVLVYSDGIGFQDANTLGTNLASYVKGGGGVVEMTFTNATIPLGGTWATGGYDAIAPTGQAQGTELTLGTRLVPTSHLFDGVRSFDGGTSSYHSTGALAAGATRLANYSDGSIFAAEQDGFGGKILSLNFYAPSSDSRSDFWQASTDGGRLMANALNVASNVTPAVPEPSSAILAGIGLASILGAARARRRPADRR